MNFAIDQAVDFYDARGVRRAARITATTAEEHYPLEGMPEGTVSLFVMMPDGCVSLDTVRYSATPLPWHWTERP